MRLIDADAMIADLLTVDPHFEAMVHWCCTVVDAQPTVDAVEVVRCRECKRWSTVIEMEGAECGLCKSWTLLEVTKSDDFCSRGERRTDE